MKMLITPEWLKKKIETEPEIPSEAGNDLEWSKNIKNEKSRICPMCKNTIYENDKSFVYLKEIYHSKCMYADSPVGLK